MKKPFTVIDMQTEDFKDLKNLNKLFTKRNVTVEKHKVDTRKASQFRFTKDSHAVRVKFGFSDIASEDVISLQKGKGKCIVLHNVT